MRQMWIVAGIAALAWGAAGAQDPSGPDEADRVEAMKAELIGQSMGGRDKGWKFQSIDQIKTLVIEETTEEDDRKVVSVSMKLEDERVPGAYEAEAEVVYEATESGEWKVSSVGLKSMKKVQ